MTAIINYILGIALLAVAGGLIYASIDRGRFALVDEAVALTCALIGPLVIWGTFRAGRSKREERRRKKQYRQAQ